MRNDFLYFSYGSNLDAERLHEHCPSARLVVAARLAGHRLDYSIESKNTWHGGVANVLPAPDHEVWGVVWLIAEAESHALDAQEGVFRDPPAYRRYPVTVETAAGNHIACRSYQVVTPSAEPIPPSPRYKQTVLRGARACDLPDAYIEALAATPDNGYTPRG